MWRCRRGARVPNIQPSVLQLRTGHMLSADRGSCLLRLAFTALTSCIPLSSGVDSCSAISTYTTTRGFRMHRQPGRHLLLAALIFLAIPAFAKHSHGDNDRSSFGSNITISEGETVGDVACAFCSVHVRGEVTGDVAVAFGSITVEPGHTVAGDTAILLGDLNLKEGSSVNGDVAVMTGNTHLAEGAVIRGSRAVVPQPI